MPIYLDYNGTTPIDPRVREAMQQDELWLPLNPSAVHAYGRKAKALILRSRDTLADYFGVRSSDILFTSGGTESLNTLLQPLSGHIISTRIEHAAVMENLMRLEKKGCAITYVDVDTSGAPMPEAIAKAIQPTTRAIILSWVNNETGSLLDLEAVANIARRHKVSLIIDGVQALGKLPMELPEGVSAVAFSAQKSYGPKGIGCIV